MKELTRYVKQAIGSLWLLSVESKRAGYKRIEMAWRIGQDSGFTVRAMRTLQARGLVEPVCDVSVELVETGQCQCGCDLWRITEKGRQYAASLPLVFPKGKSHAP